MKKIATVLALLLALALVGCAKTPALRGITVSELPKEMNTGETAELEIAYQWDLPLEEIKEEKLAEAMKGITVEYSSSDEAVATVEDGMVTALDEGTTEITVTCGEYSSSQTVAVSIPVEEITIEAISGTEGDEAVELVFAIAPEKYSGEVVWIIADEEIASLDLDSMTVNLLFPGETAIKAVAPNGIEAEATITVEEKVIAPQPANTSNSSAGGGKSSGGGSGGADNASFQSGYLPFSAIAGSETWWAIDRSDDAYWAVVNNINAMRAAAGVAPLTANGSLDAIAESRCDYMIVNGMTHDGAQTSEIIAQNYPSASTVCEGWRTSPSHYAALTNASFTQIGVGASLCNWNGMQGAYWCVCFS